MMIGYDARRRRTRNFAVALGAVASVAGPARGEAVFWDDGIGDNDRWENRRNWNPDGVPTSTSDVTLGAFLETVRIDALGAYGGGFFFDPVLRANSLTIGTTTPFAVDGELAVSFAGVFYTSLRLTSGDLTRQDVAGTEGNQSLLLKTYLLNDGVWEIAGSGGLFATSIEEMGGPRTFTKTGTGTLSASVNVSGAKTISQGTFEGTLSGAGTATIAPGAVYRPFSASSPLVVNGLPGAAFFASVQAPAFPSTLTGQLTLVDDPKFTVDAGGQLTIAGGITNNGTNSGFGFFGTGEMVLTGPGTGAIPASVIGGQLTIGHDSALGTGPVFVSDISGGAARPALAFREGVSFSSPITLRRAIVRALGNATVSSDVTLDGFVASNNDLDVPAANHTLTLSGNIGQGGVACSLTKTGAGTVLLGGGSNAYTGGTTVSAGRLNAGSAGALGTGPVTVAAGATLGVSTVDTATNLTQRVVVSSLTNNGKVDVGAGGIRITSGVGEATLRAQLIAGRNGGTWNGATGIASSTAAASGGTRQVGYELVGSSATVAYAASGDTDLNRRVDTDDILNILASGKLDQNVDANWQEGDFDYDGRANTDDILQMLAEGVLDAGPYTREGGGGSATTNLVGTFPANAKLIYNPANGNVKVDGNGFEVSGFNLEDTTADATNVFAGSQAPAFPAGGLSTTDSDTKVSWATTNSRFTGVADLGNIAVPGLTAAQLILQLNNLNAPLSSTDTFYTALSPLGRQSFDLIVVPEPGSLIVTALSGLGMLTRRRR